LFKGKIREKKKKEEKDFKKNKGKRK